jgi:hypothetical protein
MNAIAVEIANPCLCGFRWGHSQCSCLGETFVLAVWHSSAPSDLPLSQSDRLSSPNISIAVRRNIRLCGGYSFVWSVADVA